MFAKAKQLIILMLLTASFAGCNTEEINVASTTTLKVEGYISSDETSRTTYSDNGEMVSVAWRTNDLINLLPAGKGKNLYYSAQGGSGTTEFIPESEALEDIEGQKVYAYYPNNAGTTDENHVVIPSNYTQVHGQMEDYDVLMSTGTITNHKLTLKFKHLYAFLKIKIRPELLRPYDENYPYRIIKVSTSNSPLSTYSSNGQSILYSFESDSIIAESYYHSVDYHIPEDVCVQTKDELICYIAVLPFSKIDCLSIDNITRECWQKLTEKVIPSTGFKAGHVYEISMDKEGGIKEIVDKERNALIDFYKSMNGDNWINNKNWCSSLPISEWYGIGWASGGDGIKRVTQIALCGNNLSGQIPESIKDLTHLHDLYLPGNYITGNIPSSLAELPNLTDVTLNMNCLSGVVPAEIISHPSWGSFRDNISIQREGYKLEFPVYRSTDYSRDRKLIPLQTHTKGTGLKVFIVGEMYADKDISNGLYLDHAKKCMEYFFGKEPYTSFRDYFDVYCINVVSSTDIIGRGTAFNTGIEYERGTYLTNSALVLDIVRSYPETPEKDYTVIVLMKTNCSGRSNCHVYSDGVSIAFNHIDPKSDSSLENIIHHEVCGHGFGKLADEYTEFSGRHPDPSYLRDEHLRNYWMNVDYTNDPKTVCWSYFITDPTYRSENIGIFEGALYYPLGVYRPSKSSIMGAGTGGVLVEMFNAPSRRSIYQRIMDLSGETYSFEKFLEYDEINRRFFDMGGASRRSIDAEPIDIHSITVPPVIYHYPSAEAGRH